MFPMPVTSVQSKPLLSRLFLGSDIVDLLLYLRVVESKSKEDKKGDDQTGYISKV